MGFSTIRPAAPAPVLDDDEEAAAAALLGAAAAVEADPNRMARAEESAVAVAVAEAEVPVAAAPVEASAAPAAVPAPRTPLLRGSKEGRRSPRMVVPEPIPVPESEERAAAAVPSPEAAAPPVPAAGAGTAAVGTGATYLRPAVGSTATVEGRATPDPAVRAPRPPESAVVAVAAPPCSTF